MARMQNRPRLCIDIVRAGDFHLLLFFFLAWTHASCEFQSNAIYIVIYIRYNCAAYVYRPASCSRGFFVELQVINCPHGNAADRITSFDSIFTHWIWFTNSFALFQQFAPTFCIYLYRVVGNKNGVCVVCIDCSSPTISPSVNWSLDRIRKKFMCLCSKANIILRCVSECVACRCFRIIKSAPSIFLHHQFGVCTDTNESLRISILHIICYSTRKQSATGNENKKINKSKFIWHSGCIVHSNHVYSTQSHKYIRAFCSVKSECAHHRHLYICI